MKTRLMILICCCLALSACGEKAPLRVGFIGGLSDRNSDIGEAGRNGVLLAAEQVNATGGINGRRIELSIRDDAQNRDVGAKAASELVAEKVEAIVGPFTSGVAAGVVPVIDKGEVLTISPTVSSLDFYGKDDHFLRINRTTRDNASDYAAVMWARGQKAAAIAYDVRNRSFSESWLKEYRQAFTARGGRIVAEVPFESTADTAFAEVVAKMARGSPDSLVLIASAIDVARLAQQARRQLPKLPIVASEWAASEHLIELGGKAVEGVLIVQSWDRNDTSPRYQAFREAFVRRFQREPGYSSVAAYDAATVVFAAMRQRKSPESLKAAVLKYGPYEGLQQQIVFDRNGDASRKVFFAEIRDGKFVLLR